MVSDRIADFRFFLKFDRSGHGIIFSSSMLVINQECLQSTQHISGPHQDGGYYSRKEYGCFLIGLSISNFSSSLTGPDME